MLVRQLVAGVGLLFLTAVGSGQTAHPKPATEPVRPPVIVPNPKWTVKENAAQLLLDSNVQRDLKLTAETKAGVLKVYGDYHTKYTALTAGVTQGTDELADKLDAAGLNAADQAVALLSESERKRLSEVGVQAMGLDAFRMPEVRTDLHLTADQGAQFDKIFADIDAKQNSLDSALGDRLSKLNDPGPSASDDQRAAFQKAQQAVLDELAPQGHALEDSKKAAYAQIRDSFTPEERTAWSAIHGKTFGA